MDFFNKQPRHNPVNQWDGYKFDIIPLDLSKPLATKADREPDKIESMLATLDICFEAIKQGIKDGHDLQLSLQTLEVGSNEKYLQIHYKT